ncbi:membrane hypothetical protein [Vibrio nigripulchritudo SO65]|nr:membrane hypothetical protein [Vibrio nigripulchritudo AM115]CCN42947.1 membrane hypothetical protein [Vibrio nigripulchritudo FTn2]CCN65411.1 membrane hypothetical protein [Vibrio nigripulchritudo POn4]CCN79476.1 membrane hypothetical protein [Vibrio nigripulchritudo SO65]
MSYLTIFCLWISIYIGISIPDLDLKLMGILHHRSIVTHSLLLPLLILAVRTSITKALVSGIAIGISIHLAADALSPMRGFALIYLPEPFKISIGSWQSQLWLGVNSLVGGLLAMFLMKNRQILILSSYAVSSVLYAYLNEENLFVLVPCVLVLLSMLFISRVNIAK